MRILLINNQTSYIKEIMSHLTGHTVMVKQYDEPMDNLNNYDCIILSGGHGICPVNKRGDHFNEEERIIKEATIPILGICYGGELIAAVFGGTLTRLQEKIKGNQPITFISQDPFLKGLTGKDVYEAHRYSISTLPDNFIPLATSSTETEILRHQEKPIYITQFHPEKSIEGAMYFANFLALSDR